MASSLPNSNLGLLILGPDLQYWWGSKAWHGYRVDGAGICLPLPAAELGSTRSIVVKLLTSRMFSSLVPAYEQYTQEIRALSREDPNVSKALYHVELVPNQITLSMLKPE